MSLPIKLASTVWSSLSFAAREASRRGLIPSEDLGVRVVSVGNLQAGGAGKTPLVAQIANEAHERGLHVCILSRGYKGEWESSGGLIGPSASMPDPRKSGDEPALLHDLAPWAWIAVGRDRVAQFRKAKKAARFDLVILDDGFQHWKIKKDLEVVAMTSDDRENSVFRDFESELSRADLVVWTKGEREPDAHERPLVRVKYEIQRADPGSRLWLITGVAHGAHVKETAEAAGHEVVRHIELRDHSEYTKAQIEQCISDAREAGAKIAVTGKDWVKWRAHGFAPEQVLALEPKIIFLSGRENWDRILWDRS